MTLNRKFKPQTKIDRGGTLEGMAPNLSAIGLPSPVRSAPTARRREREWESRGSSRRKQAKQQQHRRRGPIQCDVIEYQTCNTWTGQGLVGRAVKQVRQTPHGSDFNPRKELRKKRCCPSVTTMEQSRPASYSVFSDPLG